MQKKQSVSEYCTLNKVTPQSVYARIKRGTLEAVKENGVSMLLIEVPNAPESDSQATINDETNTIQTLLQSIINDQKKEIKRLHKTIKQLEKQRYKDMDAMRDFLTGKASMPVLEYKKEDFVEAQVSKKKKKRKKKK